MATNKISVQSPNGFISTTKNILPRYTTPYIGIVRDNVDSTKMNRIKVWIPELSADVEKQWYTVNWCSPFAGASEQNSTYSQTSFGMWFSPPALGNQVIVMFINGDPNSGIYLGGLFQQYMNNMVPGIPNSDLDTSTDNKKNVAPATEYNKTNKETASTSTDPVRPAFKPLSDGLAVQGLSSDKIRGHSTSSGRRASPSNVNGILSQGGHQFVIDDDEDNAFIRLRTKNGTQIMINDTVGNIYMCTRNGNSWLELSDSGIDVYTTRKISMRCSGDFNVHSDSNINMFAGKFFNIVGTAGITASSGNSINVISGNQFNLQTEGAISLTSSADINLVGSGDIGIDSGGTLAIRACESIGITACGTIFNTASLIKLNSGNGPTPNSGNSAEVKDVNKLKDIEVNKSNGYNSLKTKTIVSRLPSHEPFAGHPYVNVGSDTVSLNTSLSSRTPIGTSGTTASSQPTDTSTTSTDVNNTNSTTNTTTSTKTPSASDIVSSKILPNGSIQYTKSDGSTVTDVYDAQTGKYYFNGDKNQELSPAEVSIAKSYVNNMNSTEKAYAINSSTSGTNTSNTSSSGSKGVNIFTSARSKSNSSLLGLANVGLQAASVVSAMLNNDTSVPTAQKVTTATISSGENWLSPMSGTVATLYTEDNYGVMIKPSNTQIVSPKSGTIIWAGDGKVGSLYNGYNGCVVIDHGDGTQSLISNISNIGIKDGASVKQKQYIGLSSEKTNVHFEIRSEGLPVDPSTYIKNLGTLNSTVTMGK